MSETTLETVPFHEADAQSVAVFRELVTALARAVEAGIYPADEAQDILMRHTHPLLVVGGGE